MCLVCVVRPGKLPEGIRRESREKLMVGKQYSCGGNTMSEGEKERNSLLGAGGHRTFVAVEMKKA